MTDKNDPFSTEANINMASRQARVKGLMGLINDKSLDLPKGVIMAQFSVKFGISRATANEYLENFKDGWYVHEYKYEGEIWLSTLSEECEFQDAWDKHNKVKKDE